MKNLIHTALIVTPAPAPKSDNANFGDLKQFANSEKLAERLYEVFDNWGGTHADGSYDADEGLMCAKFGTVFLRITWMGSKLQTRPNLQDPKLREVLTVCEFGPCRCRAGCQCTDQERLGSYCGCYEVCRCKQPPLPMDELDLERALEAAREAGIVELFVRNQLVADTCAGFGLPVTPVLSGAWTIRL